MSHTIRRVAGLAMLAGALAALPGVAAAGATKHCQAPDPSVKSLSITGADCRVAMGVSIDWHNHGCAAKSSCSFTSSRAHWSCRNHGTRTRCAHGRSPVVTWHR